MEFRMPEYTVNYEINKQDPYPLLSEGMRRVIDWQAAHAKDAFDTNCSWDELRHKYVEERRFWNEGGPQPHSTAETEVEGPAGPVRVRLYYPDAGTHNAIVFLHGGGFTVGSIDTHDRMMRLLMEASGSTVIGVDYHLAPEAKFPIPLYEGAAVTRYFHENAEKWNILPDRMALAGDSGGGNLALGVNLYLRDAFGGNDYIGALLLYYGSFGMMDSGSFRLYGTALDGMRRADMAYYVSCYLDSAANDDENPYFVTLNNDLTHGVPPTYLCCGALDPLLDDSRTLQEILANHGVRTQLDVVPGVLHAFLHYSKMMEESGTCLHSSGVFYRSVLEGSAE